MKKLKIIIVIILAISIILGIEYLIYKNIKSHKLIESMENNVSSTEEQGEIEREKEKIPIGNGLTYINGEIYSGDENVSDIVETKITGSKVINNNGNIKIAYRDNNHVIILYKENSQWNYSMIEKDCEVKDFLITENSKYGYIFLIENRSENDIDVLIYQSTDGLKTWNEMSKQKMKMDSKIIIEGYNDVVFNQDDTWYYANSQDEYYGTGDGGKTFTKIISYKKAVEIANKEAKKDEYIAKSFGQGFSIELEDDYYENQYPKLIVLNKDTILNYVGTAKNIGIDENKIKGQLVWGIRLGDNRDALTSMTMYMDATTGEVLGAGVFGD